MTYPLLKSIYAESVKWEHPMPAIPTSALEVIAVAAHDLSSSMTAIAGFTSLLLQLTPDDDETYPILLDMQAAAASGAANVTHLMRYAKKHGARASNKSLQSVLEEDARNQLPDGQRS